MIESQIRALFTQIAGDEPARSRVDVQLARRRGRARLRWRRACVAGGSVVAAAAVAALAVGVGPVRPGPGPAAAGPAAPRQFSPLVPYLSFGWLPAGQSLVAVVAPGGAYLTAGHNAVRPHGTSAVYAGGQCHLTGSARELNALPRTWRASPRGSPGARRPCGATARSGPVRIWSGNTPAAAGPG